MKNFMAFLISALLLGISSIYGQNRYTEDYEKGIAALTNNRGTEAEECFKNSVLKNKDAASFFQLGMIQSKKEEIGTKTLALDNLKQAALREPENLKYRIGYANVLILLAQNSGMNEYESIIKQFPDNVEPYIEYGNIIRASFIEWNNSKRFRNTGNSKDDSDMSGYAQEDFNLAEKCYLKAMEIEPQNMDAFYGLGMLYESTSNSLKALEFFQKSVEVNPNNKDAHLFTGMMLNRMNKLDEANEEFRKAIDLMGSKEKDDFNYKSVLKILEPKYELSEKKYSRQEIERKISQYWKISNPFILSGSNERLTEHYSRMAYANLHFSVRKSGIAGWTTERGEMLLRYGMPLKRTKTRPWVDPRTNRVMPKNEVWVYPTFAISFDDYIGGGNFRLTWENWMGQGRAHNPTSIPGSDVFFENAKKKNIQSYSTRSKTINVQTDIYCFADRNKADGKDLDAYFVYELPLTGLGGKVSLNKLEYSYGIFLFDEEFNSVYEKTEPAKMKNILAIIKDGANKRKTDVVKYKMPLSKVDLKFELKRSADTSYFSYAANIDGSKFYNGNPELSDIVLASEVVTDSIIAGAINRGNFSILPNINRLVKKEEPSYLYYEVYNLKAGFDGLTDFTQTIIIREHEVIKNDGTLLGGIINFLSDLSKKKPMFSLSSSYKTHENSPQQYIQLDFNKYPKGTYDLYVKIGDKLSGTSVMKKQVIGIYN